MARRKQTRGKCTFCERELSRGGLAKHLAACPQRKEAASAADRGSGTAQALYHLQVQDAWSGDFWLHLEMNGSATLADLDFYLRAIWLECCGHLSQFSIGGWSGAEIPKERPVQQVFRPGVELTHIYDFGTSSETLIKAVGVRQGKALTPHPIALMARNDPPEAHCIECGEPALWLCLECLYEQNEPGTLCDQHAKDHPHDEYGEPMPLVNSPRVGMCGYCGPADPPYGVGGVEREWGKVLQERSSDEIESHERRLSAWRQQYCNAEMVHQAEVLALRQDMVTLLTFVRDTKVVGTQSTGNMPLKAVRNVTARFVEPPLLDTTSGDRTYRLRTETDIWPLHFLHILAEVGGLLEIAPARRWRLTSMGEQLLGTAPLHQVPFLLTIWWHEVNWLVAYPFSGMGDALPSSFNLVTLACLRSLAVGTSIPFEEFADALIGKAGLTWTAADSKFATMLLRGSIERMVISILADFGAVEREVREDPVGKGTISRLAAFEITPFGQALLGAVAIPSG